MRKPAPRWRKVMRDLWLNKNRTLVVVLSIAVGVFAVGTIASSQIILSRAHRDFLRRLLENEVPEIYHGMVELRSISREPGHRSHYRRDGNR